MKKLLLALIGLLFILIILSFFRLTGKHEGIKKELLTKVESTYAHKSMDWVSAKVEGECSAKTRILVLTGTAENLSAKEEAGRIANEIEGVTDVRNNIVVQTLESGEKVSSLSSINREQQKKNEVTKVSNVSSKLDKNEEKIISIPSPYFLSIVKSKDQSIRLKGYIPNKEIHQELLNQAEKAYGKTKVVDELEEISSAPKLWSKTALFALNKLSDVDYGRFDIKNETVTFKAHVETAEKKRMLLNDLKDEFTEKYKAEYSIEAPKEEIVIIRIPYVLEVFKQENGPLTLSGYVPSKKIHKELIGKAKNIYGNDNVIDNLSEAINAPKQWSETAEKALEKLSGMDYGHFSMNFNHFNFEGSMSSKTQKNRLIADLQNEVAENYTDSYNIYVPEVVIIPQPHLVFHKKVKVVEVPSLEEMCHESFKHYLSEDKIDFSINKATIKKSSYALLKDLIDITESCPSATIIIEGHTDSDGSETYNQRLSEKRANSVKDYLVKHGINQERLISIGYGELYPIASNSTKEGKHQNRRIEFTVKGVE